jgi:PP-loop superfamily ATP-utilizing enzyme
VKLSELLEAQKPIPDGVIHGNMSKEEQLAVIKTRGQLLKDMIKAGNEISEEVQLAAVRKKINALKILLKANIVPSEAVQLAAVKRNPKNIIALIKSNIHPSETVLLNVIAGSKVYRMGSHYIRELCKIPDLTAKVIETILDDNMAFLPWVIQSGNTLTPEMLRRVLTDEKFIKQQHWRNRSNGRSTSAYEYDDFVKKYFKDNTILMNKWLRYAQNIRELTGEDDD